MSNFNGAPKRGASTDFSTLFSSFSDPTAVAFFCLNPPFALARLLRSKTAHPAALLCQCGSDAMVSSIQASPCRVISAAESVAPSKAGPTTTWMVPGYFRKPFLRQ